MNFCVNLKNLEHKSIQCAKLGLLLFSPQQGEHAGQSSYSNLLLTLDFTLNLNPKKKKKKNTREDLTFLVIDVE